VSVALVDGPVYRVGMSTGWWFHIRADRYEQAVARLEAWCIANGVARRGAEFVASAGLHFEGDENVVVVQEGRR
jgi:hypothetical protein